MPKYYCDYCKSYLTHDSTSVRKSHLLGKNHIKYVCDYYQREAQRLGIWDADEDTHIVTLDEVYGKDCPGVEEESEDEEDGLTSSEFILQPPPCLPSMPQPPMSVYPLKMEFKPEKEPEKPREVQRPAQKFTPRRGAPRGRGRGFHGRGGPGGGSGGGYGAGHSQPYPSQSRSYNQGYNSQAGGSRGHSRGSFGRGRGRGYR